MVSETQRILFSSIVSNLKAFSYEGNNTSPNVCSGFIPLELLYIDGRYQRERSSARIKSLVRNWDTKKLAPIVLVPHYEEFRFAIVDGQGRFRAAQKLGLKGLQAVVLMNAPENPDDRVKFEAECFIGQDLETEKVRPIEKHNARVILGDEAAVILNKYMKQYNIKTAVNCGQRTFGVLGSYTEAYQCSKMGGEDLIKFIFETIQYAGWSTEPNGYGRDIFRSLKYVFNHSKITSQDMGIKLRQYDPLFLAVTAAQKYPNRDRSTGFCLVALDIANT